ncbi:unnamed protein product, partial [marine sediment metagenome]
VNVDYNGALDLLEGADGFVRRAIEDKTKEKPLDRK